MAFQMLFGPRQQNQLRRKDRILRDRTHPLEIYDDHELIRRFRMPRHMILSIIDLLSDEIEPPTNRSHSIPATLQVLTALRYYASGSFQQVTADLVGLSQPSVSKIIAKTSKALALKIGYCIKFPFTQDEQFDIKHIKPPPVLEEAYICRKSFHAINVQGICDNKKRLINLDVRWPCSTHDAYMWNNCALKRWFETQPYIGHLLGDSAYPLKRYLLTLIRDPQTSAERGYNTSHKRARQRIEDTFGR